MLPNENRPITGEFPVLNGSPFDSATQDLSIQVRVKSECIVINKLIENIIT